jgi:hypothetical protein
LPALLPTSPGWKKWLPSWPTDPHWYTPQRLRDLVAAYVARERGGARPKTVKEFLGEFHGLRGSAKQATVAAAAGLSRARLGDLVAGDDIDMGAVVRLLDAMRAVVRPVKPRALGVIGEPHLAGRLAAEWGCVPASVRYKAKSGEAEGLPFVLEVAFGVRRHDGRGLVEVTGVNWSPALSNTFENLSFLLDDMRVDDGDPVVLVAHLAFPRPEFTDRGKGKLALPLNVAEALDECVGHVAKRWLKEKRRADRERDSRQRQQERFFQASAPKRLSLKEAAFQVMEEAYLHASGNRADPANARQVMYAARPRVLELTGGVCWSKSSYFTQTLLPNFIDAHPEVAKDWDVVYDARGHLIEPHTGRQIDLGTLAVRAYVRDWVSAVPEAPKPVTVPYDCPTAGPANRYRFALFVEKEGFYPLLKRHRIADRYDVAIMSTKGMSVTAARELVETLSEQGVTILVLRDFDKSGFSILDTLRTDSRRYTFRSSPNVIDIGLRLTDVQEWGLEPLAEPVYYPGKKDPRERLRAQGATEEECSFLVSQGRSGRRVELNAFTSPRFIEFVEYKFKRVGVRKVVPDAEALARAYRRAHVLARIGGAIDDVMAEVENLAEDGVKLEVPRGLKAEVARRLKGTDRAWDEVLVDIMRERTGW